MKYSLMLILCIILGCSHPNKITGNSQKTPNVPIDTAKYTVFKYDDLKRERTLRYRPFSDKNIKEATLTNAEINRMEDLIKNEVVKYNKGLNTTNNDAMYLIKKPFEYFKQLIAVTNAKGEKEVWVNCFCSRYFKDRWKKRIVMVEDGGVCFFNLKINLTQERIDYFRVNGPG